MQNIWNKLNTSVCPWWFNPSFDNPLRRLVHDPEKILGPYIQPGMTAADIGCGMGYFAIPMARMVGGGGRVYAVDIQARSLAVLSRKAERAGVADILRPVLADQNNLNLDAKVDFLLTNWMVHETPHQARFLGQATRLLKPGGLHLLVEPRVHVGQTAFDAEVEILTTLGMTIISRPEIFLSRAVVFQNK